MKRTGSKGKGSHANIKIFADRARRNPSGGRGADFALGFRVF